MFDIPLWLPSVVAIIIVIIAFKFAKKTAKIFLIVAAVVLLVSRVLPMLF